MLTITLAARMNVIEIAFASAVGATLCMRKKKDEKEKKEKDDSVIDHVPLRWRRVWNLVKVFD